MNQYSGTSISGGRWAGDFCVSPPFPGYNLWKKASYYKKSLPFNSTNYENSVFNKRTYVVNKHNEI